MSAIEPWKIAANEIADCVPDERRQLAFYGLTLDLCTLLHEHYPNLDTGPIVRMVETEPGRITFAQLAAAMVIVNSVLDTIFRRAAQGPPSPPKIDYAALVAELRKSKQNEPANILEYMAARTSATFSDIDDDGADAIPMRVTRLNRWLLGHKPPVPLAFTVSGARLHKTEHPR